MTGLFGDVAALIQHNPWLAVVAVFLAGVTTASNPCVLAMIPLMMGVVAGTADSPGLKRTFAFSLFFVIGFFVTFTALGLISALMGRMFGDVGGFWKYLAAAVCLAMGLRLLGLFRLEPGLPGTLRLRKSGKLGAFFLGLLFGAVSTPCAIPILAVLLAFVAQKGSVLYGGFLLFVYAMGHAALVLVAGTSMGAAKVLIESKGLRKTNFVLQKTAGVLMILVGAYFVLGP